MAAGRAACRAIVYAIPHVVDDVLATRLHSQFIVRSFESALPWLYNWKASGFSPHSRG